jgi:hypothetical protein
MQYKRIALHVGRSRRLGSIIIFSAIMSTYTSLATALLVATFQLSADIWSLSSPSTAVLKHDARPYVRHDAVLKHDTGPIYEAQHDILPRCLSYVCAVSVLYAISILLYPCAATLILRSMIVAAKAIPLADAEAELEVGTISWAAAIQCRTTAQNRRYRTAR